MDAQHQIQGQTYVSRGSSDWEGGDGPRPSLDLLRCSGAAVASAPLHAMRPPRAGGLCNQLHRVWHAFDRSFGFSLSSLVLCFLFRQAIGSFENASRRVYIEGLASEISVNLSRIFRASNSARFDRDEVLQMIAHVLLQSATGSHLSTYFRVYLVPSSANLALQRRSGVKLSSSAL